MGTAITNIIFSTQLLVWQEEKLIGCIFLIFKKNVTAGFILPLNAYKRTTGEYI